MDTLQNMRVFVRVVDAGSFTAAAQQMNSTTAYASRAVSDLEAHLRTRLLNRTTRRIALTEAGERYLQRCEQILAYVDQAEAEAGDAHARPSGKLKVHCFTSLGQHYLVPAIARYRERYPDVHVELTLAQRMPDLLDEGYDVAIVVGRDLPDSGLVSQRLGESHSVVCASRTRTGTGFICAFAFIARSRSRVAAAAAAAPSRTPRPIIRCVSIAAPGLRISLIPTISNCLTRVRKKMLREGQISSDCGQPRRHVARVYCSSAASSAASVAGSSSRRKSTQVRIFASRYWRDGYSA